MSQSDLGQAAGLTLYCVIRIENGKPASYATIRALAAALHIPVEALRYQHSERSERALTALASFMVALDALVVTTALSTIRRDLGVSIDALEWTVNAYTLSLAVLLIPAAALGDRFGRRRLFVAGLALFAAASAACALAPSVGWLITARVVQGRGAALMSPLALTLLSATFPPEQRARALGIFGSLTGLALIAGPVVGGAIAQGLAWQWIFWLNVPIGLIVLALTLLRIEESVGPRSALDLSGVLLVAGAALGLVWGWFAATARAGAALRSSQPW